MNCLNTCAEGSYIFVDRNTKICSQGIPTCSTGLTASFDGKKWSLACGTCSTSPFTLGSSLFCISSCSGYYNSSGCTNNNTARSNGLCTFSFVY